MDMKKRPILSMGVSHEHVIKLTLFSTDVVESMQTGFDTRGARQVPFDHTKCQFVVQSMAW